MEVTFESRNGKQVKQVFLQQIVQICRNIRSSQSLVRSQRKIKDIRDNIKIKYKGFPFPSFAVNQKLFNISVNKIYENMRSDPFNEIEQFWLNNEARRENFDVLLEMQKASLNFSGDMPKQKQMNPAQHLMELTGMKKDKADVYIREAKGNIEQAYKKFQYHEAIIIEFSTERGISKAEAESFLEAAGYDRTFADTLYKESR